MVRLGVPFAVLGVLSATLFATSLRTAVAKQEKDTCIAFVAENLARGNNNFYLYLRFSDAKHTIQAGDTLTYDVFLDPKNPVAKGGIDVQFGDGGTDLRDLGIADQNGLRAHGDGLLAPASGKWYTRRIPLDVAKGRTTASWNLVFEGDLPGWYAQFVDNVVIEHRDGTKMVVYANGLPPSREIVIDSGYSNKPTCVAVERRRLAPNADVDAVINDVNRIAVRARIFEEARHDLDLAKKFLERNPNPDLAAHVREAEALMNAAEQKDATTQEQLQEALHAAKHALSHTHPAMTKYTGHLVGHAHIDLQWLWEWQEGIVASRDTFNQALKFMDEYPGFTFSQSSSCIYEAVQENYPDIFKRLQEKVKRGQWEIVGGRVCEGDTNMISPESHARHFLYGQRYFRENFGKTAIVGWEPDTFGHTIQMPQILKLGGCDYYYFCRGGKSKPLFWWKGLDGTRILTFDEPASGSWYNADLSYQQFQEMLDFERNTGSKDALMVYGVGNHGGGPTREHLETALAWMKSGTKPKVKFSTATQFFKKLSTYDLNKIPVIDQDLNPVFDGCYTTHSEIKQLNREAEAWTTSAEAAAAVASLGGFKYPAGSFRKSWEAICFNHHHDTLPGSGIHAPYERTKTTLGRVIAEDREIVTRALEAMTLKVTPEKGGISVLVFNPLGWTRSGWVNTYLVQSGWDGGQRIDPARCAAIAPDGRRYPVELLDRQSSYARFLAAEVPAFGYRVFHLVTADNPPAAPKVEERPGFVVVTSDRLRVVFDTERGCISEILDSSNAGSLKGSFGMLENHFEEPHGMSAWVIGKVVRKETIKPKSVTTSQNGSEATVTFTYEADSVNNPGWPTTIRQSFRVQAGSGQIECDVDCDWQQIGGQGKPSPMLRAAFVSDLVKPSATLEVPFGAIARPTDGVEYPALKWGDLADSRSGFAVLNDSKHGYSFTDSEMRLTLIRSSYEPDPVPNPGRHHWRYAIVPHEGSWKSARIVQAAAEFNQPLIPSTVPFDAQGAAPLQWSPLQIQGQPVVATALKRAEDDGDLVLRMYESSGAPYQGSIRANLPVAAAWWVNFIEDRLGKADVSGASIPLNLRGYEIRTVKIKLAGNKGVDLLSGKAK